MSVNLETRIVESPDAAEIYISAVPVENAPLQEQAREVFFAICETLHSKKAEILQERIFGTKEAIGLLRGIRPGVYGDIDDGVTPAFLITQEGVSGSFAGVQVHGVISDSKPEVLEMDGIRCGRIMRLPNCEYLTLSGISAKQSPHAGREARDMLEKAEDILKRAGGDFQLVPRTWMWLGDILDWYDVFNKVRNDFFTERGMIGKKQQQSMPASTGVGLRPVNGNICSMDLIAVLAPSDSVEYVPAIGKQKSALEYNSAFSRASRTISPAGETVFVSGTASIDQAGATTNIGDAAGQIRATIENVRAVLRDMNCCDEDVVQIVAYCKTTEVEKIFHSIKGDFAWPWITVICDICRADLLFEIEAAAMPRNHN